MKEGHGRGLQNEVENLLWLPRKVEIPTAAKIAPHMSATPKWRVPLASRQKGQKKDKRTKDKPVAFGKKRWKKWEIKRLTMPVHRL
ncbi:hypothetical protein TIFTF001_053053 [Ficus carica]|uniref:Uncharacterized protein n=1 Tax=Ficus carica TaxID=3494 RepID=A0AA88EGE7_FICCA|nr:hypothetical protein TIFTF001_053053 [Ficus carica]